MRLNSSQRIRGLPDSRSTSDIIHDYNDKIQDCMKFLDESPEPFHCVSLASDRLLSEGFQYLDEDLSWRRDVRLQRGGKYFMTRSGSLIAFVVGSKFEVGNGFKVLGAHTDSPNLKLKPCSKRSGSKYIQLNVECYGGGLWHTWFDRDLSIAGRVIIRNETDDSTTYHTRLIKVDRSILRIPNLCIHLRTPDERDNFKINKEDHLVPILCDEVEKPLGNPKTVTNSTNSVADTTTLKKENTIMNESKTIPNKDSTITEGSWVSSQQPELIHLLAKELNCKAEDITDFELSLYDVQKAAQTGLSKEYICSSRVDNLASCYVVLDVLLDYGKSMEDLKNDTDISLIALFDHEEVGSGSSVGAGSALMRDTMERIHYAFDNSLELSSSSTPSTLNTLDLNELFKISLSRSMILSVDMAHAVHPNYASKHEKSHSPRINGGVVIKSNVNQRYSTVGVTGFFVRELGRRAGVPLQEFSVRNDCPCGTTIGPIISQNTGVRAVDLGMPMLSMHSIREIMGAADLFYAHKLFLIFLTEFRSLDVSLEVSKKSI